MRAGTFEPLEIDQSYVPLLKALLCGINAVGAQGFGCMFTLCHTSLKMGLLLHKTEIVCRVMLCNIWGKITAVPIKMKMQLKYLPKEFNAQVTFGLIVFTANFGPKSH